MKKLQTKKTIKKTAIKKDMSISELAGMVARGFTDVEEHLGGRISGVEERLESVDGRLTILDHKVDRVQDSVNELSYNSRKTRTRIENLEFKVFGSIQEA